MVACFSVIGTSPASARVIYVKILVDEEERTRRDVWQIRLKQRLDRASEIINEYCDIQFALSEFGVWQSDNRETQINRSLREFEQEVEVAPAQIAIGFTSQYRFRKGINGLGGTRGPLHTHILIREASPNTQEPERLEALVHELGHFLGAAHSGNPKSVMRPIIANGLTRFNGSPIAFDRRNAKILQLVGTEVSALGLQKFHQLSDLTRRRLLVEYKGLAAELPQDPAAKQYIRYLHRRARQPTSTSQLRLPVAPQGRQRSTSAPR